MKIKLDKNYKGLIKGKVTKFGNGAKISVPKKYIGESVDILIEDNSYLSGKNMPDKYYGD